MVTTFNTKDMVQFTNWMMQRVKDGKKESDPSGDFQVTDADIQNWKFHKSKTMKVRAKFVCTRLEDNEGDAITVHLSACIEGSPENKEFCKYTPYGSLSLGIDKDAEALNLFLQGEEYYLDFVKAE